LKEFNTIKKNEMLKTIDILNDLSEKFPMLKYNDINFASLGKFAGLKEKDFKTMIVFMDMVRSKGAFVSMDDLSELRVKKKDLKWKFIMVSKEKKEMIPLEHTFEF